MESGPVAPAFATSLRSGSTSAAEVEWDGCSGSRSVAHAFQRQHNDSFT